MYTKRIELLAAAGLLLLVFCMPAPATVVNFDDRTGTGTLTSYAGITWTNWTYYDTFESFDLLPHSGSTRLYKTTTSFLHPTASWEFSEPVRFQGAWFSSSFNLPGMNYAKVGYKLYDASGVCVYSPFTLATLTGSMSWVGCSYSDAVKRVVIAEPIGTSGLPENPKWVMDDVTYEAVPEPSSLMALALGLGGLAPLIRRRPA